VTSEYIKVNRKFGKKYIEKQEQEWKASEEHSQQEKTSKASEGTTKVSHNGSSNHDIPSPVQIYQIVSTAEVEDSCQAIEVMLD